MKLSEARVRMFRNVIDSGTIRFQDDVTALVGKNESGKTALLMALHRLNPANGSAEFSLQKDYPRWRLTRDRKSGEAEDVEPIRATFTLDDEDVAEAEALYGVGVLPERIFTYYKTYSNKAWRVLDVSERAALDHIFGFLGTPTDLRAKIDAPSLKEARGLAEALAEELEDSEGEAAAATKGLCDEFVEKIDETIPKDTTLRALVGNLLGKRLPKFFYFSDYQTLPSRIDLQSIGSEEETPGASANQTARALIRLAGADTANVQAEDFDERKSELEAASNELTRQVFEYWTQNSNLSVEIDADKKVVGNSYNQSTVVRFLEVRVKDSRHGFTGSFDQRSKGFQWFFSFFAAFSEFEDRGNEVIVLLDEPAMSLHGKAQADFLRFINERLGARSQVVYTTHSPFMVEPNRVERVRIVEDKGPDSGSVVTEDVHTVGGDATFPLQAALGYDIAQNLLIGPDNLLLEGGSDDTYLRIMSDHLRSLGREGLDPRWRIVSTHGATNMPAFVSLFAELDVTLLIDGTSKSTGKLDTLVRAKALPQKRVISTNDFAAMEPSDIEDLFTPGEYLKLYNPAFGSNLKVSDLNGTDRIIARIGRANGETFKEHGKPAEYLMRSADREKFLGALSEGTIDRWASLFEAINKTLSA
ncbi:ATP-binding protein [Curtobacterium sp. TC1]|uniref:AAA family ATPase n=1 Tax=Curtobacterium sp. TC1 TaxID=2862880 RepID=UPI001C9B4770|nr:AAA family ATPase [Curtobacterium sp. TC1]QZQ54442.1 ATP-binding protein [Curtobacterium sp. TC1]